MIPVILPALDDHSFVLLLISINNQPENSPSLLPPHLLPRTYTVLLLLLIVWSSAFRRDNNIITWYGMACASCLLCSVVGLLFLQ